MADPARRRNGELGRTVGVAVVGAGPAGLAVSARLARGRVPHVVLERDRVGSSWRTQRWDSFRLNSPVWATRVTDGYLDDGRETFATAEAFVGALERLADGLPVVEGVEVHEARGSRRGWRLQTSRGTLRAERVVVASGFQNVPRLPQYARDLPPSVAQLHVADYRRPADVTGGVLVVGGAQSGVQIAQDLIEAGRDVHLATSRVARIPRRYRGRDAFEWMRDLGHLDLAREDAGDEVIGTTAPQLSGIGEHRTVSYQALARAGVKLVGRVRGVDGGRVKLDADVGANVRFADDASRAFRALCDTHADATRHVDDAHDPADEPAEHLYEMRGPGSLDLRAAGVSTVVWATGFGASIGWLPERAVDGFGRAQLPGLDVVGAPWLTHRASSNLYGMVTDAERVAASLADVQPAPRLHHSSARLAALRTVRPTLRVAVG